MANEANETAFVLQVEFASLVPVMDHLDTTVVRRALRILALAPAAVLVTVAGPALAAPPEQWPAPPPVTPLDWLLVLVIIPLGLAAVITLLTVLPSMVKGEKGGASTYQPGVAWRHEPEWFGGPRDGLEKADKAAPAAGQSATDRGGASGRW
jgi:hypothetical protein